MTNDTDGIRQRHAERSVFNDVHDTITLPKSEYDRLTAFEDSAKSYDSLKKVLLWLLVGVCFIVFMLSLVTVMKDPTCKDIKENVDPIKHYESELSHLKQEALASQDKLNESPGAFMKYRRPGRLYHRGGNYGRKG